MMDMLALGAEQAIEDVPTVHSSAVSAEPSEAVSAPVSAPASTSKVVSPGPEAKAPAQTAVEPAAPVVPTSMGHKLAALVASKVGGQVGAVDEREAWADETTKKLKTALNGYGLQAAILGTRLTPNGCLVRLAGSDRLRVEDIEAKRTQLLTTHAINLVTVQPKPGEIVVTIAGAKRQSAGRRHGVTLVVGQFGRFRVRRRRRRVRRRCRSRSGGGGAGGRHCGGGRSGIHCGEQSSGSVRIGDGGGRRTGRGGGRCDGGARRDVQALRAASGVQQLHHTVFAARQPHGLQHKRQRFVGFAALDQLLGA